MTLVPDPDTPDSTNGFDHTPPSFGKMFRLMTQDMLASPVIHTGTWQSMDTSKSSLHRTHEMLDVFVKYEVPQGLTALQEDVRPDLPWADDHFRERVSGSPLNPAPSHNWWPYGKRSNSDHTDSAGKFDHTYPERYWPRWANDQGVPRNAKSHQGIRFRYGDLDDVVNLLARQPYTRQAYFPVWFPEDTGARDGGKDIRVPCSLGYHFLIRDGRLSCRYYLRSCDLYRHFRNDVYMTARLMQWVCAKVQEEAHKLSLFGVRTDPFPPIKPGELYIVISSFHLFVPDVNKVKEMANEYS